MNVSGQIVANQVKFWYACSKLEKLKFIPIQNPEKLLSTALQTQSGVRNFIEIRFDERNKFAPSIEE